MINFFFQAIPSKRDAVCALSLKEVKKDWFVYLCFLYLFK